MATNYWKGGATAVAQISTVQITAYDAATTYKVTIGGVVVSVVGSGGTPTTVATALAAALNASTHPYFEAVTWTSATDTVTGTAATAGVPFTATSSVSGGAGTIGAVATPTASSGPNDWSTAANWSLAAVPVNTDEVVLKDSSSNICWGLAQSAVTLNSLRVDKTFTGRVGLAITQFATVSDGTTASTTAAPEYRSDYCAVGITSGGAVKIGENLSQSSAAGSTRLKFDFGTTDPVITILATASSSADTGLPAVRFKVVHASAKLYVRSAAGGVGVAVDAPGEVSTLSLIDITDTTTTTKVYMGPSVTLTTWRGDGGACVIGGAAATMTACTVSGGTLRIEGDFTITTLTVNGGTVTDNHIKTGGNANTTIAHNGGTLDATGSAAARTWSAYTPAIGSTLIENTNVLTVTTRYGASGNRVVTTTVGTNGYQKTLVESAVT
mgnify:CR=1 FL=1